MKQYLTLSLLLLSFSNCLSQDTKGQNDKLVTSLIQYVDKIKKGSLIWISEPEMNEQKKKVIDLIDDYKGFSQDTPKKLIDLSIEMESEHLRKLLDKHSSDKEILIKNLIDWKNIEKMDTLSLEGNELSKLNLLMKELITTLGTKNDYKDPEKFLLAEDLVYFQIDELTTKFTYLLKRLIK